MIDHSKTVNFLQRLLCLMIDLSVKELFIFLPSFSACHVFIRFFPFLCGFILLVCGDSEP